MEVGRGGGGGGGEERDENSSRAPMFTTVSFCHLHKYDR